MRALLLLVVLCGAGCGYTILMPPSDDVGPTHVWITRSVGCSRTGVSGAHIVPGVRDQLEAAGVGIVRFEEEGNVACQYSGRPGPLPAILYVLIPRADLAAAKRLGFRREYGFERGVAPPGYESPARGG